jgi:hypothetical protein
MIEKLRKPDGNNIRKIPRRSDMIISTKVTKTAEDDALMESPVLSLSIIVSEALELPSKQLTPLVIFKRP